MKKIKVLEIGMSYKIGGIESFLINYCSRMEDVDFCFINVFENAKKEEFYKKISNIGKIYNLPDYRKHPIKFVKEIKRIQEKEHFDILHYNMNSAVYLTPLIAGKIAKIKTRIAHSHNSSSDKGILKLLLHQINKNFIPLFANYYFACSDLAGIWFFSKKTRKTNHYNIINNAINISEYEYNSEIRTKKRKELGINKNDFVIGHVGRFKPQKNHIFLVELIKKINKENNNIKLLLIGEGPLKSDIKKMIIENRLEDTVLLLGERNDTNELYQAMDLFVLPSIYEGLPIVGIEAQASMLPCIE